MGETFEMKFSEGFRNDIFDLMDKCVDMNSRSATVTISDDEQYRIEARIEFKVIRKNAIEKAEEKDGEKQ